MELVQQYLDDLKAMSFHLFSCNWNYSQLTYLKDNLKSGQLLQVLDFSQNYINVYQDEPQSVHWDHSMTVIHPIVNYYKTEDGKKITEEHIMLSDDLLHDKFAVRAFEKTTMDHLRAKGIVPKQIIQFCDNCVGQYESKGPFQLISESNFPTVWLFFGARHRKGPADGVVGRIKAAARRAVKSRKAIIGNAEEFTNFCKEKFEKKTFKPEGEQHFIQEFFYVTNINRHKKIEAVTTAHTKSFFSICSTGNFCVIEAREVSCICEGCMFGDGQECPNQAYVSSRKAFNLHTVKPILAEAFHNTDWITPESNAPESNAPESNGHAEENCCRSHRN